MALSSLVISTSVQRIGYNAFCLGSFTNAAVFTIPTSVTFIDTVIWIIILNEIYVILIFKQYFVPFCYFQWAFCNNYGLQSLNIPTSLFTISAGSFLANTVLKSIEIPTYGQNLFYSPYFDEIFSLRSVTSVGAEAFQCKVLLNYIYLYSANISVHPLQGAILFLMSPYLLRWHGLGNRLLQTPHWRAYLFQLVSLSLMRQQKKLPLNLSN